MQKTKKTKAMLKKEDLERRLDEAQDKLGDDDLDEIVNQAKSQEATAINNDGLEAQVDYLLYAFTQEEVVKMLEATLETKS
jgi:hypothetical protein